MYYPSMVFAGICIFFIEKMTLLHYEQMFSVFIETGFINVGINLLDLYHDLVDK